MIFLCFPCHRLLEKKNPIFIHARQEFTASFCFFIIALSLHSTGHSHGSTKQSRLRRRREKNGFFMDRSFSHCSCLDFLLFFFSLKSVHPFSLDTFIFSCSSCLLLYELPYFVTSFSNRSFPHLRLKKKIKKNENILSKKKLFPNIIRTPFLQRTRQESSELRSEGKKKQTAAKAFFLNKRREKTMLIFNIFILATYIAKKKNLLVWFSFATWCQHFSD